MAASKAEAIAFIRCLLLSREGEMYLLSEFLRDFEAEAGYSLPQFEYKSVVDFLGSIPDTVEVVASDGELYLSFADEEESYDTDELLTPDLKVDVLGQYLNRELVHTSMPLGTKLIRFKKKKRKNRRRNRDKKEKSKFGDQERNGEVYNPHGMCKKCMTEQPAVGPKIDFYLSNIVLYASDIPQLDLEDQVSAGDLIEVTVPEVSTPHRFILHLRKYQFELSKFMGRMMTFYAIYCNKYALENDSFKENEVCAALWGPNNQVREWYRAKVVNAGTDASTVFLMDYGLTVEVSRSNLKYLDRFFGNLPTQAINGCLANVRPCAGENWSQDCSKRFHKLVMDKDLLAYVADTNYQKQWLSVVLSYSDSGALISDVLVKESTAADCELCEDESFSPAVCESGNPEEFIPREIEEGFYKLRCELGDHEVDNAREKAWFEGSNKQLRKMIGVAVSDEDSSSSSVG